MERTVQQSAELVSGWLREGRRVVAGTLVEVEGSSPLDVGASMYVTDGEIEGSVTGGCVEGAVAEAGFEILATDGRPRLVRYGISDELAGTVGLMCGGIVYIFIHELRGYAREAHLRYLAAIVEDRPAALATLLDGETAGAKLYTDAESRTGGLGVTRLLDGNVERESRGLLAEGRSTIRSFGEDGASLGSGVRVHVAANAEPPRMIIFGAIDFSSALAPLATGLGYRVTIADPRKAFLASPRFSASADTVAAWPDAVLAGTELGSRDAVLVFTHDPKLDVPAVTAALATGAGYIGALGSRKTTADRERRLRDVGVSEEAIARVFAPCGLDIGASTVEETAVAVLAEIVAMRAGRAGRPLREGEGSIRHADAEAGHDPGVAPVDRVGRVSTPRTLGELALAAAERYSGDALRAPGRVPISYAELGTAIREIAGGLASLGVEPGDRVAILGGTRPEWTLADFGTFGSGAVVVPVYHTNSPEECEYVLAHSGAKVLIAEDAAQVAKVAGRRGALGNLEHIVVMEGTADGATPMGELRLRAEGDVTTERLAAVRPGDPATIVYTSGTTGPPKGCVLTHANLLSTATAYIDRLGLRDAPPVIFNYLPLAHVLARMVQFVTIETGGVLAFWGGDTKRLAGDIAEAQPSHIPTVPRLLEKIHTRVLTSATGVKGEILKRSLATASRVAARRREGRRPSPLDVARHAVGDRLALSKIRAALGENDPVVITGAAPIGREVLEFFDAVGIPVLEGYGMTETCAAATLNTVAETRLGSVGRALPGTEVSLGADDEILMRGALVFGGYYRNEEATAEVLDGEGWMHSGDLGRIDDDGYVFITGRKKDLVITSSGKNISPELIESALRETRWISQAVVAGDRRSYLVALVTLDPDEAPRLAAELDVPADPDAMVSSERVRQAVWEDIEAANRRFARIEQVKRFALLPRDLSQEDGELTPTLKVKRAAVYEKYRGLIDQLYDGGPE